MSDFPSEPIRRYVIDAENVAEMARLMIQDRLLTHAMGELVPSAIDLAHISSVLDIACGTGGWVLDMATQYPHINAVGIDISTIMIDYATSLAHDRALSNIQFQVTDVTQSLPFADQTFDLINGRILMGFLTTDQWPPLLQECFRMLKPGGILRLSEPEFGFTNSFALETFTAFAAHSFYLAGHTFSHGHSFGLAMMLPSFLRKTHFQEIQRKPYCVDFSAETDIHNENVQNLRIVYSLLQPLLIQSGLSSQEELQRLYVRLEEELRAEWFCGMDMYLSVWGQKPFETATQRQH